ncbi:MAG: hypothetical protein ACE5F2_02135 [Candidatus Paceibacteria bacterium]
MNIRKGLSCFLPLLFICICIIGCETTAPRFGYIQPSEEVVNAYKDRDASIPIDGVYLDFGKDGGYTTQRVVWVTDQNGKILDNQPLVNYGENLTGRLFSNTGTFIGAGTLTASPFWGYFGQKARRADRTNVSVSGGTGSATATASSNP